MRELVSVLPQRSIDDMAEQQFSMRTAASTVSAVKRSVTPSTRSKARPLAEQVGQRGRLGAQRHGLRARKDQRLCAGSRGQRLFTPARIARRDCSGDSDTPLPKPVAFLVSTKVACGKSGRFSAMNTSSPLPITTGAPYSPASAP
jgi:hypothetical protein